MLGRSAVIFLARLRESVAYETTRSPSKTQRVLAGAKHGSIAVYMVLPSQSANAWHSQRSMVPVRQHK